MINYDLEKRLINFAVLVINITDLLPNTRTGNHIAGQIVRCGTSPAANYGEAQSAESRSDFIHKMKICLKELRESHVWLQIIEQTELLTTHKCEYLLDESNQLISIFVKSIQTARMNKGNRKYTN